MGKVFLFAFATIQCGCVSAQVYVCVSGCVFCCARIYTCAANICIQFFYSFSLFFFSNGRRDSEYDDENVSGSSSNSNISSSGGGNTCECKTNTTMPIHADRRVQIVKLRLRVVGNEAHYIQAKTTAIERYSNSITLGGRSVCLWRIDEWKRRIDDTIPTNALRHTCILVDLNRLGPMYVRISSLLIQQQRTANDRNEHIHI